MIQPATLRFLKALTKNNHKDWFDQHRNEYETAKQNFRELVELLIREHGKTAMFASVKIKRLIKPTWVPVFRQVEKNLYWPVTIFI
jgi:uncharacterized protein (DUF2461 family)